MTERLRVPFLDLAALHRELEDELTPVFRNALLSAAFIGGPAVENFEQEFAGFCGAKFCAGVGSGTDALRFALIAAGVGHGDIVLTVPNTFIATTEAISQTGALPDFVDVDEHTSNLDVKKLAEYLEIRCFFDSHTGHLVQRSSGRTVRAIVPVHLYGQMADMDDILELAERYNILVIEDACQAHGAEYFSRRRNAWQRAGSMGIAAAFSFYPGKNLGACGEAGAVTTSDEAIARKVRMLRDHGQSQKYFHDVEGYNGRLDAIQAGILSIKLRHLEHWNEKRREAASRYDRLLSSAVPDLVLPHAPDWSRAVYHLYVVRVKAREQFQSFLAQSNIGTAIHYPIPLHLQKAYAAFGYKPGDFPVAERLAPDIVSLPMFPQIGFDQQRYVAENIVQFLTEVDGKAAQPVISAA